MIIDEWEHNYDFDYNVWGPTDMAEEFFDLRLGYIEAGVITSPVFKYRGIDGHNRPYVWNCNFKKIDMALMRL